MIYTWNIWKKNTVQNITNLLKIFPFNGNAFVGALRSTTALGSSGEPAQVKISANDTGGEVN